MTNRNRSSWGLGLLALMLLTFGLAGCGGSEPAAVQTPPAPSPAPPPFVPQAVEVALGTSGDTLTLMTTEAGGYTLNGEAFASGTEHESEKNGSIYKLTLDGTQWSAVYQAPDPQSIALGTHGGNVSIERLEDGSFQLNGSALTSGAVVPGENNNSYTVTVNDDGKWTAEWVQPPAQSIPLGQSGSSVDVRINEDGTFSAMISGEWMMITAETRVEAANGNVYRAQLVNGIPVGVEHVAAMVEVMLGELGGTLGLTQMEDKSWVISGSDTAVMDGYVHMAANGNEYKLMMDSEGMWSAMYQEVMVTVALGTQGSITLTRSEDMSWWFGSEAVMAGSSVRSANGNEYTLVDVDGAWSADFVPVEMMISGTGLVAYSREGDDMYDVNGSTLDASGVGSPTLDDGSMYHIWMTEDGGLAGARVDAAQKHGRYNVAIGNTTLSVDNEADLLAAQGYDTTKVKTTVANELNTHLKVKDQYFSLDSLLGTGQASRVGAGTSIVSDALDEVRDLRQKAASTLDVFPDASDAAQRTTALTSLWTKVQTQVTGIFGDKVDLPSARRDDRILDDFDDIIAALSDVTAFQDATASGGGGVFAGAKLSADAAAAAFAAEKVGATATLGVLGNTRFGAFWKKERTDATSKLADPAAGNLGAFAYGTTGTLQTLRTRHVPQGTGSALYSGLTEAVDGKGNFFSGDIEIQVRFAANQVNAVVRNLTGATGAWEYLYANTAVAEIILPDTRLGGNASWTSGSKTSGASVVYSTRAGIPRPVDAAYTFAGRLLGRDAGNEGNEAVGVWSLGSSGDGKNYLAGGFGAMRGTDLPDIRPEPDSGEGSKTKILSFTDILRDPIAAEITAAGQRDTDGDGTNDAVNRTALAGMTGVDPFWNTDNPDSRGQTIAGGVLTVVGYERGPDRQRIEDRDDTTKTPASTVNHLVNDAKYRTHKIDLVAALEQPYVIQRSHGDNFVDLARASIEKQLRILESDIGLAASDKAKAWETFQQALVNNLFHDSAVGELPGTLGSTYSANSNVDFVRAATEALEALQSNAALTAALGSGGIFDGLAHERWVPHLEFWVDHHVWERTNSIVSYAVGATDFTRFGAWRRSFHQSASGGGYAFWNNTEEGDGPNSFSYSQLGETTYRGLSDPRYPNGARLTYEGSTIAYLRNHFFQGTVDIEVLWGDAAGQNQGDPRGISAKLNMSIANLERLDDGSPLYLDADITSDQVPASGSLLSDLEEVVSINISAIDVDATLGLAANSSSTAVDVYSVRSGQLAPQRTPWIAAGSAPDDMIDGQFVGQGVSGPLAVLGGYRISGRSAVNVNNGTDYRNHAIGGVYYRDNEVKVTGLTRFTMHGGFGAELP